MTQQPSIGRIVHYQSYGTPNGEYLPEPRAAIITEIPELLSEQPNSGPDGYVPAVGLCVLNPTGQFFNREVPYADEPTPGHWNWPPRIGPAPSVHNTHAQDMDRAIDELAHKAGLTADPKRHGA